MASKGPSPVRSKAQKPIPRKSRETQKSKRHGSSAISQDPHLAVRSNKFLALDPMQQSQKEGLNFSKTQAVMERIGSHV